MNGVTLEKLSDTIGVYISKEHRFGTDALLLADFAAPRTTDVAVDLGTGCGIIPMLWCRDFKFKAAVGVEISETAAQLAKMSAEQFSGGRVDIVQGDIRHAADFLPRGSFSLVSCNPPYFRKGSGPERNGEKGKARHDGDCTVDDVAEAARYLLKFGGRVCVCQRPDRLCDVFYAFKSRGIEPKKLQFVAKSSDSEPWLCLVEAKKGAAPGLKILPNRIV